jgi:hypothetical protein
LKSQALIPQAYSIFILTKMGFAFYINPNYALEAKRPNALARILGLEIGFNPDLATLGFHQKGFS